jgi:long-chain-fatty-acid--CoA ligase ACSBG
VSEHSQAAVVCCQDAAQVAKYVEVRDKLPKLKAIVVWEGEVPAGANDGNPRARVYTWDEFLSAGRNTSDAVGAEVRQAMDAQKPEDPVTLIYTSGTTGNPKAVMLSNDNVTWTSMSMFVGLGAHFGNPDDPVGEAAVSYLPLSHIAAQVIDIHLPMFCAGRKGSNFVVTFADKMALKGTLLKSLLQARPTFFLGVPRVWEKVSQTQRTRSSHRTIDIHTYIHTQHCLTHLLAAYIYYPAPQVHLLVFEDIYVLTNDFFSFPSEFIILFSINVNQCHVRVVR